MVKPQQKMRNVAVLIESTRDYSRKLIRGIAQFNDEHGHWRIEYRPGELSAPVPPWIKTWKGDGILARINDRRLLRLLLKIGIPVVDLRRKFSLPSLPRIGPDDQAAVDSIFEHFRRRGFARFGFVGFPRNEHAMMDLRRRRFHELTASEDFECSELEVSLPELESNARRGEQRLIRWLRKLPRFTAILACNDDLGLRVLNACRVAGIPVPGEVAVSGIGNDDCLCELAVPKLTSVDLNPVQIGYEAAAMLESLINRTAFSPTFRIKPARIVSRMSTNTIATEDDIVLSSLHLIRTRACAGLTVRDVLRHVRVSRATLENRFRSILGRTVFQEIIAVRLERARELLISTDMTIKEIAQQTGFEYQAYLMRVFQQRTGQTMRAFRLSHRTS